MDKHRKIMAMGMPRHRYLEFVGAEGAFRVLTYMTEKKAQAARNGFFTSDAVDVYIKEPYFPEMTANRGFACWDFMEPVEVEIAIKEVSESPVADKFKEVA